MKSLLKIKCPKIADVHQKALQYDAHKKKLQQIKHVRRNDLKYDNTRNYKIQLLKQGKSQTFRNKFNQQVDKILKGNTMLLQKIAQTKKSPNHHTNSDLKNKSYSISNYKHIFKEKTISTQRQNQRMLNKMLTISSTISARKLRSDYQTNLQMRKRLMRYSSDCNKVSLKTQKSYDMIRKSNVSYISTGSRYKQTSSLHSPSKLVNHYKKDQIIKNKLNLKSDNGIFHLRRQRSNLNSNRLLNVKRTFPTQPQIKQHVYSNKIFK